MNNYIAFLRAINVGGRAIKMEAFKELFESLKLKNVKTFIQSGNVLFGTNAKDPGMLCTKIERKLESFLGYEVKVMLRTFEEIREIVEHNPFKDEKIDKDTGVYIAFLYNKPGKGIKSLVASLNSINGKYFLIDSEVYCKVNRDEKTGGFFSIIQLEKKLGIPLTMRNQTTSE